MAAFITIGPTERILFLGNSITAVPFRWFAAPGGMADQINWASPGSSVVNPGVPGRAFTAVPNGTKARLAGVPATSRALYTRNPANSENGFPGQDVTLFAANWAARANAFNPDVIIMETGANDEAQVRAALKTVQDIMDGYTSCFAQAAAFKASTRIVVCSAFCFAGETWQTPGNPDWVSQSRLTLVALTALIAPLPNVALADWNTQHLAWQVAHNPVNNTVNVTTIDGTHPNDVGKMLMARFTMPSLRFT